MDCGDPSNVTNGMVIFTSTTFGSNAAYSCNTGYTLTGDWHGCVELMDCTVDQNLHVTVSQFVGDCNFSACTVEVFLIILCVCFSLCISMLYICSACDIFSASLCKYKIRKCNVVGMAEQISKKHRHQVIMSSKCYMQTWVPWLMSNK